MNANQAWRIRRGIQIARADKILFTRIVPLRLAGREEFASLLEWIVVKSIVRLLPFMVGLIAPPFWSRTGRAWSREMFR